MSRSVAASSALLTPTTPTTTPIPTGRCSSCSPIATAWRLPPPRSFRYNDANIVFRPAQMSPRDVQEGYLRLWREFYADKQHYRDHDAANRTIQF